MQFGKIESDPAGLMEATVHSTDGERSVQLFFARDKELVLSDIIERLESQGYEIKLFTKETFAEILDAIADNRVVADVDITKKMQADNFRFMTADMPIHSLKVSHAMAAFLKNSRSIETKNASVKGVEKRNDNADNFALSMFDIVEKIKTENDGISIRGIVDELNKQGIPTYQKGKNDKANSWHTSSIQNLNKRWQALGLTSEKEHQPK